MIEAIDALNVLQETTNVLLDALRKGDLAKAHEAVSVLLMQGIDFYGLNHPVIQQCLPVWDAIKGHIDRGDTRRALEQTETWGHQLTEVIELVRAGQPNAELG